MAKSSFSGHESFVCKQLWLKKGFDFLNEKGGVFRADEAVTALGVGKNMVRSIDFWLRAFGLIDKEKELTEFSKLLLDTKTGLDPYLEDIGSLWLLHYRLVSTEEASIYNIFFNEFVPQSPDFTKDRLANYICSKEKANGNSVNRRSVEKDILVFLRNYLQPSKKDKDLEDSFSSLFIDLGLMQVSQKRGIDDKVEDWYFLRDSTYFDLPSKVLLYTIIDWREKAGRNENISLRELLTEKNAPGLVFALSEDRLLKYAEELLELYPEMAFAGGNTGLQTLRVPMSFDKNSILNDYYGA